MTDRQNVTDAQAVAEQAADLRAYADQFTHQRDVNFVEECADKLLSLAADLAQAQAEAARLRAGMEKMREWAIEERGQAWDYEAVTKGDVLAPHRKGAAMHLLVGRISKLLAPAEVQS